jgi:hypothetical protein
LESIFESVEEVGGEVPGVRIVSIGSNQENKGRTGC